jgi:hypothetical protein
MDVDTISSAIYNDIGGQTYCRCVKCFKIVISSPDYLDDNGNLILHDIDRKRHSCFGADIIEETHERSPDRLTEDLFLAIVRHKHLDGQTGRIKRTYEDHVGILFFMLIPTFTLHLSHIEDNKLRQELADLDQKTLDNVMRDAIGKLFECITSERQYNLSIRNRLEWEMVD